jgi:hypothetical protein
MEDNDYAAIDAAAQNCALAVLRHYLPGGEIRGREYAVRNPTRVDRHVGSFSINLDTFKYADFAVSDFKGQGAISLVARLKNLDWAAASRDLVTFLNIKVDDGSVIKEGPTGGAPDESDEHLDPAPITFESPYPEFGPADRTWHYCDANGDTRLVALRWNRADGDKVFRYASCWQTPSGPQWRPKMPAGNRPLYNGELLPKHPESPVLIVEGEKATDAAAERFPGMVCLTSPGGAQAAAKADWSNLRGRQVVILPDNDLVGRSYAQKVAELAVSTGAASAAVVDIPDTWPAGWDIADPLPPGVTPDDVLALIERARVQPGSEPSPTLSQAEGEAAMPSDVAVNGVRCPERFPVEALGPILSNAAEAIHDFTKAPMALCGQSVLAVASLIAQAQVDVRLPTGATKPSSCFFLSVAESGERKSSCDSLALSGVRKHLQRERMKQASAMVRYDNDLEVWKLGRNKVLKSIGDANETQTASVRSLEEFGGQPKHPPEPRFLCSEPTMEGLCKLLKCNVGFAGIFSAEGGAFIGGYGMSSENKLRTAAQLSTLWDGSPLERIRQGDDFYTLDGRRVTVHLMAQPLVAAGFLTDEMLNGQGLLSRFLVLAPLPAAGTRHFSEPSELSQRSLAIFHERTEALLSSKLLHADGEDNQLTPRVLDLSPEARALWIEFYNRIEDCLGEDGQFACIPGFANKAAEHAARLAAVQTFFDDSSAASVGAEVMARSICLVEYYLGETVRLIQGASVDPNKPVADKLLKFIRDRGGTVAVKDILQYGPPATRSAKMMKIMLDYLVEHGLIERAQARPEKWRIRE